MRTASLDTPPVMADVDDEWRQYGSCVGNPEMVDLMFRHNCIHKCTSTNGRNCQSDPNVDAAKGICADCPVLDHCRWWAVLSNLLFGVAGGLTYAERLVVRRRLKRTADGRELLRKDIEVSWE